MGQVNTNNPISSAEKSEGVRENLLHVKHILDRSYRFICNAFRIYNSKAVFCLVRILLHVKFV